MEVSEIFPNIWMGNSKAANSRIFHKSKKIKLSVNCSTNLPTPSIDGIQTFRCKTRDIDEMYSQIRPITELIGKAFKKLIPVLIWCEDGKQASAAIIASFYIRFTGTPWDSTVRMIQSKRPDAFRPQISYVSCLSKLQTEFAPDNHDFL